MGYTLVLTGREKILLDKLLDREMNLLKAQLELSKDLDSLKSKLNPNSQNGIDGLSDIEH